MTRNRPDFAMDWRPTLLVAALYMVFLIAALLLDVLPAMRAVLEAT